MVKKLIWRLRFLPGPPLFLSKHKHFSLSGGQVIRLTKTSIKHGTVQVSLWKETKAIIKMQRWRAWSATHSQTLALDMTSDHAVWVGCTMSGFVSCPWQDTNYTNCTFSLCGLFQRMCTCEGCCWIYENVRLVQTICPSALMSWF